MVQCQKIVIDNILRHEVAILKENVQHPIAFFTGNALIVVMLLVWFMMLGGFEIPMEESSEEMEDEEVCELQDTNYKKSESVTLSCFEPSETQTISRSMSCMTIDKID